MKILLSCDTILSDPNGQLDKKQYRVYIYPDELQHLILMENGIEKYYSVISTEAPDNTTLILEVHQEDN